MKKFRSVPAIITLVAGFAACVVMIINRYTLLSFMWTLLGIMAAFYVIGLLARFALNKAFEEPKEDEKSDNPEENDSEDTNEDKDAMDTETVDEK